MEVTVSDLTEVTDASSPLEINQSQALVAPLSPPQLRIIPCEQAKHQASVWLPCVRS